MTTELRATAPACEFRSKSFFRWFCSTMLWLCLAGLANTALAQDAMVSETDRAEILGMIQGGQCDPACENDFWRLARVSFPSGAVASDAKGQRLYSIIGQPIVNCGAGRCMHGFLLLSDGQLAELKMGLGVDSDTIAATDLPGSGGIADLARAANLPMGSYANLLNLQADDYALLDSAARAIKDATGVDDMAKSVLLSAVTQAANMAYSPILQKFVLEKFALDSKLIFQGVVANPKAYFDDAAKGAGKDMMKAVAIDVAASIVADAMFSFRPLSELTPEWKAPLYAMTKATVSETANLAFSSTDPSEAVSGIAERLYDFYEIYKASVGVADVQNDAVVSTAISLEVAARLVTLHPSPKATAIARSTLADAVDGLNTAFGDGYSQAMTDIVRLTFLGILSEMQGDTADAAAKVALIRKAGKLGADDNLPSVLAHPINWIAALASWSGDPPSRTAALMISATILGDLEGRAGSGAAADPVEPVAAAASGRWGPDIVSKQGLSDGVRECSKGDGRNCLSGHGLSQAQIDFNLAAFDGYPNVGVASEFRELGAVDWVQAAVVYSPYEATVLVNGNPDIIWPEPTRDLWTVYSDATSRSMLKRFPGATVIGGWVGAHRILPDGTQRFVLGETVFDKCHACPILGSAISFLEFDRGGNLVTRRPIGLDLSAPEDTVEMTAKLVLQRPEVLQVSLNSLGYDAGPMDGVPGAQSRQALMEFQVEHCLPPTGQLNEESAEALVSADSFVASCANARLPAGISANAPILSGTYVDSPDKCHLDILPDIESLTSLYIVREMGHQSGGFDQNCTVRRTDLIKGLTRFSGDCTLEGSVPAPSQWFADVKTNDQFTVWYGDPVGQGQAFSRCADDTPLAKANTTETTETAAVPDAALNLRAYCAANPNDPGTGENGTVDPEVIAAGGNTWRCMDSKVLICYLGASGRACQATHGPNDQQVAELQEFCRQNPNNSYIPNSLTNGLASEWGCDGTKPVSTGASAVDRLGYFVGAWKPLGPGTTATVTPAASAGALALPVTQGIYLTSSDGDLAACSYGMDAEGVLEIKSSKLKFYEASCQIARTVPAGQSGDLIVTTRCTGEGQEWTDDKRFHRLSDVSFDLGNNRYQLCPGQTPKVATAAAPSDGGAATMLADLAGKAFEGNVRTHPADAYAPNANYDVQISVDDQGEATYRGGIRSPPWRCVGHLSPVSGFENQVVLAFKRTTGNDDFIVRCPAEGQIALTIGGPSGPLEFAWTSLAEDNATGSLPLLDAAAFAAQQPPPNVDPCAQSAWDGAVQSPVDLFLCDQTRAMTMFAQDHEMSFAVPASGLTLRDGWYYASYATRGTSVESTVKSMEVNGMKGWDEWLKVTSAQIYTVTCAFYAADNPDLTPGTRVVSAKLVQFSGGTLLFSCR